MPTAFIAFVASSPALQCRSSSVRASELAFCLHRSWRSFYASNLSFWRAGASAEVWAAHLGVSRRMDCLAFWGGVLARA